jgi:hypothetical protein
MKKFPFFIIPVILVCIFSCKKPSNSGVKITGDDAANIIAGSLATNTNGITTISANMALNSTTLYSNNPGCGVTHTDSVTQQSVAGAQTTFSYKVKYINKLNCNTSNQPDNVTSVVNCNGNFNTPGVAVTNSGNANFTVAGLVPTSIFYVINGEFKYNGTFKLKADTTNVGTVSIDMLAKNITITKSTVTNPSSITAGSATISIIGNTPKRGSFNFNGVLIYNGSGTALLTLNGIAYIIDLTTGAVAKQ